MHARARACVRADVFWRAMPLSRQSATVCNSGRPETTLGVWAQGAKNVAQGPTWRAWAAANRYYQRDGLGGGHANESRGKFEFVS